MEAFRGSKAALVGESGATVMEVQSSQLSDALAAGAVEFVPHIAALTRVTA